MATTPLLKNALRKSIDTHSGDWVFYLPTSMYATRVAPVFAGLGSGGTLHMHAAQALRKPST
jgi:hypothetical protein